MAVTAANSCASFAKNEDNFQDSPCEISELAGLWLAEGDNKSEYEITITNNCIYLICFSHRILTRLFGRKKFRIYIYLPKKDFRLRARLPDVTVKRYYTDRRANQPYFILRLASTNLVEKWKHIVKEKCSRKQYYGSILRGFFAGEGNIKNGSHHNRQIRIAQKQPKKEITAILNHLGIEWKFSNRERAYVISGRANWDKAARIRIANLHPEKKKRFFEVYGGYVQLHHKKNFILNNIMQHLDEPKTSMELAEIFKRTQSRIQRILTRLKRVGRVRDYKVRSRCYWVNEKTGIIPVSKRKKQILDLLEKPRRTYEVAALLKMNDKSALRRLRELRQLGLAERKEFCWYKIPTDDEVRVYE